MDTQTLVNSKNIEYLNYIESLKFNLYKSKLNCNILELKQTIYSSFKSIGDGYYLSKNPDDYLFYTHDMINLLCQESMNNLIRESQYSHTIANETWKQNLWNEFGTGWMSERETYSGLWIDTVLNYCNLAKLSNDYSTSNKFWAIAAHHAFPSNNYNFHYHMDFNEYFSLGLIVGKDYTVTIPIRLLKDPESFKRKCCYIGSRSDFSYEGSYPIETTKTQRAKNYKSYTSYLNSIKDHKAIINAYLLNP